MIFPNSGAPYYIVTPAWNRCSAGVKVLHFLCHYLNKAGQNAYLVHMGKEGEHYANPLLQAPYLTQENREFFKKEAIEPIVVYAEIIRGNPVNAKRVVRYLLYYAGEFGGPKAYEEQDIIYAYSRTIAEHYGRGEVLTIPVSDPEVFYSRERERSGTVFYSNKHRLQGGQLQEITKHSVEITKEWPKNHNDLAKLFRRSEVFYAYEDTSLMIEALLCGCKVARLDGRKEFPEFSSVNSYFEVLGDFKNSLDKFIKNTQEAPYL